MSISSTSCSSKNAARNSERVALERVLEGHLADLLLDLPRALHVDCGRDAGVGVGRHLVVRSVLDGLSRREAAAAVGPHVAAAFSALGAFSVGHVDY